ncbi:MAG TPA: hypothetical protein VJP78_09275 [Thermoleophilia bacterium]|nr:hypothetical protein [Thermoleophilia bacterium]
MTWLLSGIGALVVIVALVCVLVFVVFAGDNDGQEASAPTNVGGAVSSLTTVPAAVTTAQTVAPTSTTEATVKETSDPEEVVLAVFEAMENQDAGAILALMDPAALGDLPEGTTWEAVEATMVEELAAMGNMEFSGIETFTEMTSETTATVTLTSGTVTVTDSEGLTTSEDVEDADSPVTIDLVKVDGEWYLESTPFMQTG